MHTRFQILKMLFSLSVSGLLSLSATFLTSCRGDEVIYPTIGTHVTNEVQEGGLYVLCEGNMGSNKARLDYINLEKGDYYSNWYGAQNPRRMKELGDVGNDIQQYGGRLYMVINCSHLIEVTDLQARHIGQIEIPNCRYMAFKDDKLYVSSYVGSIASPEMLGSVFEIDTATLEIKREVKVGHQPDELCVLDDKLYVCNSGGYLTNRYDSTVSVIDLHSFTEIEKIPVGLNPTRLRVDDRNHLWVCCSGTYETASQHVVILDNTATLKQMNLYASNISILGSTAYLLDGEAHTLRAFSTADFSEQPCPIDISAYEHPYGLLATEHALYVTDAKNYVSSGVLHCYDYSGREHWRAMTGDIPGHLCRVPNAYDLYPDTTKPVDVHKYLSRVYEYVPAMGQFVNELPKYENGDDEASMCLKCEKALAGNAGGLVSLGGWGGYITFGFDHAIENKDGRDIQILGNAFYMAGSTEYGSSEPGIVMVSRDENGNGVPDDRWYELKGCLYDSQTYVSRTYTRASDTIHNEFHQHPYYPQWIEADSLTFTGALLPSQTVVISGQNVQRILDYGYADNKPNNDIDGTSFDISWAIDESGQPVALPSIDFVRVYCAVDESLEITGELSTEISGAVDLHY